MKRITSAVSIVLVVLMFACACKMEHDAMGLVAFFLTGWMTADAVGRFSRAWFAPSRKHED